MSTYIHEPTEVDAVQLTWPNQNDVRALLREEFDVHGYMIVYVHNAQDDLWVEQHRANFGRIGIVGDNFTAVENDWLVKGIDGLVYVLKPWLFKRLYNKPE